jgi:hypothetical protein
MTFADLGRKSERRNSRIANLQPNIAFIVNPAVDPI